MSLESFERFRKTGIVKKQKPDISRAKSLIEESDKRKKFLENVLDKIGLNEINANYISEGVYDIVIGLIRAKMLVDGFSASGHSAHAAEISYMRFMDFSESEINIMDRLRKFRNKVKYYGKQLTIEYAQNMLKILDKNYERILGLIKKDI